MVEIFLPHIGCNQTPREKSVDEVFASLKNSHLWGVRTSAQISLGTRSVWMRTEPLLQFVATALSLKFP